jgi:hypothetical protein
VAGAKQVAEKGQYLNEGHEMHPSGAEALVDLIAFAARLKSCPLTKLASIESLQQPETFACHEYSNAITLGPGVTNWTGYHALIDCYLRA